MVRVTVVDDNPELLDLMREILSGERYETTLIGADHTDDLQRICRSEPDLLMIDLRHGDDVLHGWRVVQQLRRAAGCEDLPVLIWSADRRALSQVRPGIEAAGRVGTLELPFELDELTQSIDRLVSGPPGARSRA